VIDRMRPRISSVSVEGWRPLAGLLPLLVGSVLVALLATAAGPTSSGWLFQSPVSPVGPTPSGSSVTPQGTATGPALVSVRVAPNFVPWLVGLAVIVAIVGVTMWWRGRGQEGGASE
jgi:hypothetical protein